MFKPRKKTQVQKEFWVVAERLPKASPSRFYELLNRTLEAMDFAEQVRAICAPADAARGGRPGIDPVVYFKMLMVGFFEGLESERAIAARCADSLSLRGFLGYALDEATPDHSSMSVIRQRLGSECFARVFALVLAALQRHGLLKGRHLGIDSSVIEANASLRNLSERNTEEGYWSYVQRLAKEAGLETTEGAALRSFDRKRVGKKMSNAQWHNPHDPDAKIGRTKDGATDMVYLPEHTVDLETGAIVQAQVLAGDHRDSEEFSERVIEAVINVQEAQADPKALPETLTGDKGYFSLEEMGRLQALTLKTVISDPHRAQRRFDRLSSAQRQVLARAQRSVSSKYGRALLRQRGQHIERSFAHVLDAGGLRRTTLRGLENLNKRHQIAAACYNLSQLLPRLYGVGTPKQWMASCADFFVTVLCRFLLAPLRAAVTLGNLRLRLLHPLHSNRHHTAKPSFFDSLLGKLLPAPRRDGLPRHMERPA
jgi:transposase